MEDDEETGHEQAPVAPEITEARVRRLTRMLEEPARYVQRCVDQLAFMPQGGHQWTRSLQIQIPSGKLAHDEPADEDTPRDPQDDEWHVVSLGPFQRRRLPDLKVTDAAGERVNLVTRRQHGAILSRSLLGPMLTVLREEYPAAAQQISTADSETLPAEYHQLLQGMYDIFTTVGDVDDHVREAQRAIEPLAELLKHMGIEDYMPYVEVLLSTLVKLLQRNVTYYLCWVKARPGDIVNLEVTYSTFDPLQRLDRQPVGGGSWWRWLPRLVGLMRLSDAGSEWMRGYRLFGLAPLNYAFQGPDPRHGGSFYFTLDPPPHTIVTMVCCGQQHTMETDDPSDRDRDCAFESIHTHNDAHPYDDSGERPAQAGPDNGEKIFAYLRPNLREHKMIAAAAVINLAFVLLICLGRLTDRLGTSSQSWVLVTPTIITGFLAQQQRHYYALATRRHRAVLWGYLTFSIAFLGAVSFSLAKSTAHSGQWGAGVFVTGLILSATSAAIICLYFPLGQMYERITQRWTRQLLAAAPPAATVREALRRTWARAWARVLRRIRVTPVWARDLLADGEPRMTARRATGRLLARSIARSLAVMRIRPRWARGVLAESKRSLGVKDAYEKAVLRYCACIMVVAGVFAAGATIGFLELWSHRSATSDLRVTGVHFDRPTIVSRRGEHAILRYRVSRAGRVTVTAVQRRGGVAIDTGCVLPGPRTSKVAQRCDLPVLRLTREVSAGPHLVKIRRRLKPGKYQLIVRARPGHTASRRVVDLHVEKPKGAPPAQAPAAGGHASADPTKPD